jgi:hypothetical protein
VARAAPGIVLESVQSIAHASPDETPFLERSLPYQSLDDGYHRYEVVKELPVWEGRIAPAMGQPGGGIQYYLPYSAVDLLIAGYIREVT